MDILDRTDEELPWYSFAPSIMVNDQNVIKSKNSLTFFEHGLYQGKPVVSRNFKSPLLGKNGQSIGTIGICVLVTEKSLISLTPQQTACLKHLALGYTHKQIANALGLSHKTVEHYLGAIKVKLNCNTRNELIVQAIERGLVGVF